MAVLEIWDLVFAIIHNILAAGEEAKAVHWGLVDCDSLPFIQPNRVLNEQ